MGKLKSQTSEASGGGVFDIAEPARKTGVLDFHDEGFNQRQQQLVIESEEVRAGSSGQKDFSRLFARCLSFYFLCYAY